MRKLLLALVLTLGLEASAIFSSDFTGFDASLYKTPQEENPALNKRVDFSFKDTMLSDIMLMVSRVGEFNIVLPEEYDRRVTITITKQRVIDAIEDISKLTGLLYQFKGKTLIMSKSDVQGLNFIAVPVVHYSSEKIVKSLNEVLFKQLAITQDERAVQPYAAEDPSKNAVILVGNEDQIKAAKDYIKVVDSPPNVKIYTPSYIDLQGARQLIKAHFDRKNTIKIKRFEKNSLLIKGSEEEVREALSLIEVADTTPSVVNLAVEVYTVAPKSLRNFKQMNSLIDYGRLHKIKLDNFSQKPQSSMFSYLMKIDDFKLSLKHNQEFDIYDTKISAKKSLIDDSKFMLKAFGETLAAASDEDVVCYLFNKKKLNSFKQLRKLATKGQDPEVLVVFKLL